MYQGLPARVTDPSVAAGEQAGSHGALRRLGDGSRHHTGGAEQDFLPDLSLVGSPTWGATTCFTTSGTTGKPRSWCTTARRGGCCTSWPASAPGAPFGCGASCPFLHGAEVRSAVLFATGGTTAGSSSPRASGDDTFLRRRARAVGARPVEGLVAELNEYQPTLLSAYPSALALVAEEQIAGRLRISPLQAITAGRR